MLSFLLSLAVTFMAPTGLSMPAAPVAAVAQPAAPSPAAAAPGLGWLDGTWRSGGLEMVCTATGGGADCREEGKSGPLQGAVADLKFAAGGEGAQLTLTLPSVPSSIFAEIAREAQSATYEMKTPTGVARLRFTRIGDELKVERGNASGWGQALTYRRG